MTLLVGQKHQLNFRLHKVIVFVVKLFQNIFHYRDTPAYNKDSLRERLNDIDFLAKLGKTLDENSISYTPSMNFDTHRIYSITISW